MGRVHEESTEPITIEVDGNLLLKQHTLSDAQSLFSLIDLSREHLAIYGDDETGVKYPDLSAVQASISDPRDPTRLRFGIWDDDILVGSINITPDEDDLAQVQIGYWVGEQFLRKGYASRSSRALARYGYEEMNAKLVYALVDELNEPSKGVLRKAGFNLASLRNGIETYTFEKET